MKTSRKAPLFSALLAVLLHSPLLAQHYFYYNEGDTIHGRDTIYPYQWWSEEWLADSSNRLHVEPTLFVCYDSEHQSIVDYSLNSSHYFMGRILRYCYTEQPLRIVGIATSLLVQESSAHWGSPTDENPYMDEYLLLYDAAADSFPLVGQLLYNHTRAVRYMDVDVRTMTPVYCPPSPNLFNQIVPIREHYFDKPIIVYDSFYVGHTQNSNWFYYNSDIV